MIRCEAIRTQAAVLSLSAVESCLFATIRDEFPNH